MRDKRRRLAKRARQGFSGLQFALKCGELGEEFPGAKFCLDANASLPMVGEPLSFHAVPLKAFHANYGHVSTPAWQANFWQTDVTAPLSPSIH